MSDASDKAQRPSLRQLEYFVAVALSRSFRRAAERLGVSQPTLTAQIGSLEQSIDARLFERGRSGTILSAVGRELLRDARRVLEEFDGFLELVHSLTSGPGGTYRLGVSPTVGPYLLPHLLPTIHRDYAAVKFHVREDFPGALEEGLIHGEYDLLIITLPIGSRQLAHVSLCREPLMVVLPSDHRLARKARIQGDDLVGEQVLAIEERHPLNSQMRGLCERFGASIRRDYEGTSLDTLRQMVVLGMGISFLPALYVDSEIRDGDGLKVLPIGIESISREHALVWRAASPSRALFRELGMQMRKIIRTSLSKVTLPAH